MHAILVWAHVGLMLVAFGASPLGRLGLRYLLAQGAGPQAAADIVRGFSGIFLVGGISVTCGVGIGLMLAWHDHLADAWVAASFALIAIAGGGGVAVEGRWLDRLRLAEGAAFTAVMHEKIPFIAALASPAVWLFILWLMIAKPA